MKYQDTIFALASGTGRAGVAIIRVSGNGCDEVLKALTEIKLPAIRMASVRKIRARDRSIIDEALVLRFGGPASFTGEDMLELQIHGSRASIAAVSGRLFELGLRHAGPGEFTRRAVINGKMDLTEAEGLADLIDANTEGQRKQALQQMQGGLRGVYEAWRSQILDALAFVEGEIDFPDEEGVPDALAQRAGPLLIGLVNNMSKALGEAGRGETVRHGVEVAILGAPNVGKSSILNRLSGREAAIVSNMAGTTRDIVDVHMEIAGLPVRLSDTAGLRDSSDEIEQEGVKRAQKRARDADIRVFVTSADTDDQLAEHKEFLGLDNDAIESSFHVINKSDLLNTEIPENANPLSFTISSKTGAGYTALEEGLTQYIVENFAYTETAGLTRARHRDCVTRALAALRYAIDNIGHAPELAGADLREALHGIKELAGETDIEAVLDRVFSSFCIGK